ncbi:hypothetical protein TYRP_000119, partial [Tyrophagus putrescentiae]
HETPPAEVLSITLLQFSSNESVKANDACKSINGIECKARSSSIKVGSDQVQFSETHSLQQLVLNGQCRLRHRRVVFAHRKVGVILCEDHYGMLVRPLTSLHRTRVQARVGTALKVNAPAATHFVDLRRLDYTVAVADSLCVQLFHCVGHIRRRALLPGVDGAVNAPTEGSLKGGPLFVRVDALIASNVNGHHALGLHLSGHSHHITAPATVALYGAENHASLDGEVGFTSLQTSTDRSDDVF